jgi:hypothetical protein
MQCPAWKIALSAAVRAAGREDRRAERADSCQAQNHDERGDEDALSVQHDTGLSHARRSAGKSTSAR